MQVYLVPIVFWGLPVRHTAYFSTAYSCSQFQACNHCIFARPPQGFFIKFYQGHSRECYTSLLTFTL